MTRIGLKLVKLANEHRPKVPTISYFCQLKPIKDIRCEEIAETKGLTSLICALIGQILEKFSDPLPLKNDIDMSNRF